MEEHRAEGGVCLGGGVGEETILTGDFDVELGVRGGECSEEGGETGEGEGVELGSGVGLESGLDEVVEAYWHAAQDKRESFSTLCLACIWHSCSPEIIDKRSDSVHHAQRHIHLQNPSVWLDEIGVLAHLDFQLFRVGIQPPGDEVCSVCAGDSASAFVDHPVQI